ncbi:MAG: hypothetical protein FWD23_04065, partial [Oscillospiraceae bacterium]|nr:hypothetical protein [Oscillospiraceae bacterium]
ALSETTSPPIIQDEAHISSKTPETSAKITTQEPSAPEPTTPENTMEIQNYLIFCDNDYENTDKKLKIEEILAELDKNDKMKAVFFLSAEEILKNPEILKSIYAFGHSPGIKFDQAETDGGSLELREQLETANALIYSVIKHKTKFCIAAGPDVYEDDPVPKGYYLVGHTAGIRDLKNIKSADEMVDFIKQQRYNVFMFDIHDDYKQYLEWFSYAAKSKFYINFSHINNANVSMIEIPAERRR